MGRFALRVFAIVIRELKSFISDRADLAFSILLPVALMALMVAVFGGEGDFHPTTHVVDDDGGIYARELIDRLSEDLTVEQMQMTEAEDRLDRSQILQAVIIPEGFSDDIESEIETELVLMMRGSGGIEGQVVRNIVRDHLSAIEVDRDIQMGIINLAESMGLSSDNPRVNKYAENFAEREREKPLVGVSVIIAGETHPPIIDFLPSVLTMFLLFTVTLNAISLIKEREAGTLRRIMVSGARLYEIFLGKFFAHAARGLMGAVFIMVLSEIFFSVFTLVSFVQFFLLAAAFVFATSGFGLLIGSTFHTRDAATWAAVFFTMAMSSAGGTFHDPEAAGSMMEMAARLTPNYYANSGLEALLTGANLGEVLTAFAALFVTFLASFLLAVFSFRFSAGGEAR